MGGAHAMAKALGAEQAVGMVVAEVVAVAETAQATVPATRAATRIEISVAAKMAIEIWKMPSPRTTHRAISARARRKTAFAQGVALVADLAAAVANPLVPHKADSPTRCALALT